MSEKFRSKQETEAKHGAVRLFFEMDKKTETSLKKRIEEAKGLIRVFIHPDFERYSRFENIKDRPEDVEKLREAEQIFRKILSSKSETMPPLFIFEDGISNEDFEEKEEQLRKLTANDTFIIRTSFANPDPLPIGKERTYQWPDLRNAEKSRGEQFFMWQWLIEELKKLGVKKILIGGLEFYTTDDKNKNHSGCMGIAMNKLKAHFEIEISTLTWPNKR